MSEIGIPYDMDNKKAYKDGKYGDQYAAMDANNFALEGAGLNYTLWCYCSNVCTQYVSPDYRTRINGVTFGTAKTFLFGVKTMSLLTHQTHSTKKKSTGEIGVLKIPIPHVGRFTTLDMAMNLFPRIWRSRSPTKRVLKMDQEQWKHLFDLRRLQLRVFQYHIPSILPTVLFN